MLPDGMDVQEALAVCEDPTLGWSLQFWVTIADPVVSHTSLVVLRPRGSGGRDDEIQLMRMLMARLNMCFSLAQPVVCPLSHAVPPSVIYGS